MKDQVLNELAAKWERDSLPLNCEDGSEYAQIGNARADGFRKGQAQCADQLRQLIKLLGEDERFEGRAVMVKGL